MKQKAIKLIFTAFAVTAVLAGCGAGGNKPAETSGNGQTTSGTPAQTTDAPAATDGKDDEPEMYHYKNASYAENGTNLAFGVLNEINLFEPNTDVTYYITSSGRKLNGKNATVTVSGEMLEENIVNTVTLGGGEKTGSFRPEENGIYTLSLTVEDTDISLKFDIAVVPAAKTANMNFSWGTQPYFARLYLGRNVKVLGQSSVDRSENSMIKTIQYMGLNCIREDSVYWGDMQPAADSEMNFTYTDKLLNLANSHGMTLMYTIGTPPVWAYRDEYKNDTDTCYNVCPKTEYWEEFCRQIALHYKDTKKNDLIWEIWNEPDMEFFYGTKEEFAELLEIGARTIRQNDPDAFIISGGLVSPIGDATSDCKWYKPGAGTLYLSTAKKLIAEGALNTYATHLHYPFNNDFFEFIDNGIGLAEKASGIENNGAFNTESGVCTDDDDIQSQDNVAKALWFRTHGYGGFTLFSFSNYSEEKDPWSIFNGYLQPRKSVISYTAMLGLVGQATEVEKIADDRSIFADIFYDGERSVVTVYSDGEGTGGILTLPEGREYKKYDLYGNERSAGQNRIQASAKVIYIVYDGKVSASDFTFTLGK